MQVSLLGTLLLVLAAAAAGVMAVAGLVPSRDRRVHAIAASAATALLMAIGGAFALLMYAYSQTDVSLLNVFLNSNSLKPMVYKLTGTWGNHEGSLLLWLLMLAGFGAAMAHSRGGAPEMRRLALGIQGLLTLAFLLFAILTSSPFEPYPADWPTPVDGQGLNPLLQDIGLAIHPPTLYVGYVGLSAVYSFTIAALIRGELDQDWARAVRPFLLFAWAALTLGIGLGAFWAYYELGWGGFWFWDPVENASLMPWLAATALLHCVMVVERRDALKPWCAALAILAFGASLLGAFLVRSGIVTSVHAFANDPERGVVLLLLSVLFTGGGFLLFALRGSKLVKNEAFEPVSREGALVLNNLLFSVLLFTVFLGTFWPTVVEVSSGTRISVGPPYYNLMAAPLTLAMAAALAFGLLIPWRKRGRGAWVRPYQLILGAGLLLASAATLVLGGSLLAWIGFAASIIVFGGVVADLLRKAGLPGADASEALRRLANLPGRSVGALLSHLGLALLILGVTSASLFQTEVRTALRPGESAEIRNLTLTFVSTEMRAGRNYLAETDRYTVERDGKVIAELYPSRRYYPVADEGTTEVAITRVGLGNLYLASAGIREDKDLRMVRAYVHPLIHLLWSGALLVAIGGFVAAFSPGTKRQQKEAEPNAPAVPA
ncbi:heme lyase CcmF/NrfE family subunit [Parvularcula lutaonensis]|uniref:Heme lyase CcmF/NrfE family subunit n=1 Tax=Parvularcula lutaonensis TaxID=491923 RepID=A0ABV7M8V4_9PROT|nr:heme lyase CcmF/NrfE family subunit [Parvularcula lutaonensis]GGY45072.1 c-type cytochrome biogenesis protein CcmF [Parvularcula lutaonensis]